ncbi:hypothetical protein L6452_01816 [Arctium lappa]|uniref:Uncharacterized protein n=1 Tax=Arctium lappa TaxID=4217 RepID=A0ACB9FII5_ARCLA|nr:hypothetical protein L6452_01816 [Arctium lappa]
MLGAQGNEASEQEGDASISKQRFSWGCCSYNCYAALCFQAEGEDVPIAMRETQKRCGVVEYKKKLLGQKQFLLNLSQYLSPT